MTARRHLFVGLGLGILLGLWAGPLPALAGQSYTAHMILHMGVVAVAAPILAAGLAPVFAGGRLMPFLGVATLIDMVVVWAWHLPALHDLSRSYGWAMTLEQASFAGAALLVWLPAFVVPPLVGALALFFTAMHMTLLGVLIGLSPRLLGHSHHSSGLPGLTPLQDQQVGGVVMMAAAGIVYAGAALWLAGRGLQAGGVSR
jgi:putative membrane protein